jgi:predicted deacetylase
MALRANRDLLYTSTLTRLHLLPAVASLRAPCVTYSTRTAWRRTCSRLWNPTLAHSTRSMPLIRLGLHPDDASDAAIRRSWQRCLAHLLEDRRAVTKAQFAREWASSLRGSPRIEATPLGAS